MYWIKVQCEYDDLDKYQDHNSIYYYKKDTQIVHNPYGPAFVAKNGYISYYINGKWHRLDGPARIYANGKEGYWINNIELTKEEFDMNPERLKFLDKEHLLCLI